MFELLWWQQVLLTVVFAADLALLTHLAWNELNDWRLMHGRKTAPMPHGRVPTASPPTFCQSCEGYAMPGLPPSTA